MNDITGLQEKYKSGIYTLRGYVFESLECLSAEGIIDAQQLDLQDVADRLDLSTEQVRSVLKHERDMFIGYRIRDRRFKS